MALRRVSLWVDEKVYEGYKVLAPSFRLTTTACMRTALENALPEWKDFANEYSLDIAMAQSGRGVVSSEPGNQDS